MEIKLRGKELKITHKLSKGETYKISQNRKFQSISIFKKPTKVKGISSYCEGGKHCLFIDYDSVPRWLVEQDYFMIQEKYKLPPAYLLTTKEEKDECGDMIGNYHIICIAKIKPAIIYRILSYTHADVNYMSMPLRNKYRNWILRISNKGKRNRPKLLGIIGKIKNLEQKISNAHFKFLRKIYRLPEINYKNKDGGSKVFLQEYETLNT